jgi:hypothetical protein
MNILRSVLAVVVGLVLISAIVEPLEFLLVGLLNRGLTTDPDIYFQVRNQPAVLVAKLVYNTAAAIAGGWVAAWLARRTPVAHGIALAVIQTAAFGWALANPALRRSTPDWMWACLIVLTFAGTVVGSLLQSRRIALADKRRAGLQANGVQAD